MYVRHTCCLPYTTHGLLHFSNVIAEIAVEIVSTQLYRRISSIYDENYGCTVSALLDLEMLVFLTEVLRFVYVCIQLIPHVHHVTSCKYKTTFVLSKANMQIVSQTVLVSNYIDEVNAQ